MAACFKVLGGGGRGDAQDLFGHFFIFAHDLCPFFQQIPVCEAVCHVLALIGWMKYKKNENYLIPAGENTMVRKLLEYEAGFSEFYG